MVCICEIFEAETEVFVEEVTIEDFAERYDDLNDLICCLHEEYPGCYVRSVRMLPKKVIPPDEA